MEIKGIEKVQEKNNLNGTKKYVILSGKGGVGKSTVSVNLAAAMALTGKTVGLLDADLHGPSVAKMLGLTTYRASGSEGAIDPAVLMDGALKVMSVQFMLAGEYDSVIWRGPLKHSIIKQFVSDTLWNNPDFLFVDLPPGTGDEPLSVLQTLKDTDGAIVVTTPQSVSTFDVRKSIDFCRKMNLKIFGIVENMGGFVCPKCGEVTHLFGKGGGEQMAKDEGVPFLGSIPLDPLMVVSSDASKMFVKEYSDSPAAQKIKSIADTILAG